VRKLIESTFVTLGGDIGSPQEWGPPYLFCDDGGRLTGTRTLSTGVVAATYEP
jgi:hypothetical protein